METWLYSLLSNRQAALVSMIIGALPFAAVFGAMYRLLLTDRAHLSDVGGIGFYAMFIGIVIVSALVHELLHGLGWALAGGRG